MESPAARRNQRRGMDPPATRTTKRPHRRRPSKMERLLLGVFLLVVFLMCVSIVLVPLTLENADYSENDSVNNSPLEDAKPKKEPAAASTNNNNAHQDHFVAAIESLADNKSNTAGETTKRNGAQSKPRDPVAAAKPKKKVASVSSTHQDHFVAAIQSLRDDNNSKNKPVVGETQSKQHHPSGVVESKPGAERYKNSKNKRNKRNKRNKENSDYFLSHSSPYHTIVSTGCSIFQDWQSYVFFYHVFHAKQEGHVTRIASGCRANKAIQLRKLFRKEIQSMNKGHHHLHQTPNFSLVPKKHKEAYKYFNKPFGVKHWMEHALGYPDNHALHDDSIIILMDPDQVLLRPFTNDFSNSSELWRSPKKRRLKVEHGSPFAQQYGYQLSPFDKVRPEYVFGNSTTPSPITNLSRYELNVYHFSMGPPYIATAKDMWSLVSTWSEIAPKVHDEYPHLLAEMFAYNIAAAHLQFKHTIALSFMVSDPYAGGEGWSLIDAVEPERICPASGYPASELPHVLHYCQDYYLGKWFIGKKKLPKDFVSCEAPLLKIPPDDLAVRNYTSGYLYKPGGPPQFKEHRLKQAKEMAFMLCAMIEALNAAAKFYKDTHCSKETANYNYTYVFFDDMSMPNNNNETDARAE